MGAYREDKVRPGRDLWRVNRASERKQSAAGSPARAPRPRDLTDEFLDGYVSWREECIALEGAYELWRYAQPRDRTLAFAAYLAALEREEQAARVLRKYSERLRRPSGTHH
jgi:hypothetical protein